MCVYSRRGLRDTGTKTKGMALALDKRQSVNMTYGAINIHYRVVPASTIPAKFIARSRTWSGRRAVIIQSDPSPSSARAGTDVASAVHPLSRGRGHGDGGRAPPMRGGGLNLIVGRGRLASAAVFTSPREGALTVFKEKYGEFARGFIVLPASRKPLKTTVLREI